MGSYKVSLLPTALREFEAVPFPFRRQLHQRVMQLKTTPRPAGSSALADAWHVMPVHGWLMLYVINDALETVTVVAFVPETTDE